MNAKINDLIRQSYVTVRSQNDRDVTYFSQEKFAELIVRECIDIAIAEECWAPYQGPVESEIRKHFGVEE